MKTADNINYDIVAERRRYNKKLYSKHYTLTVRLEEKQSGDERVQRLVGKTLEELLQMERVFDTDVKKAARALYEIDLARRLKRAAPRKHQENLVVARQQRWKELAEQVRTILGTGTFTSGEFCRELNKSIGNPFPGINTSTNAHGVLKELAHNDARFKLRRTHTETSSISKWFIDIS